jgi:hypothetical protein
MQIYVCRARLFTLNPLIKVSLVISQSLTAKINRLDCAASFEVLGRKTALICSLSLVHHALFGNADI